MANELTPKIVLEMIEKEFDVKGQAKLARFLDRTQGLISQLRKKKRITKTNLLTFLRGAFEAGRKDGLSEVNGNILDAFGVLTGAKTQAQIAKSLKKNQSAVAQWKSGYSPLSSKTITAILKASQPISIRKIFEMKIVEPGKPGGKWYLFSDTNDERNKQVEKQLGDRRGVYCYFDTRGHLTYVGKADKTPLAKEVPGRLNANVAKTKLRYWENLKKPQVTIRQGNIVKFVSAYEVSPKDAIPLVEAILIRVTANSQFNNRLENLSK